MVTKNDGPYDKGLAAFFISLILSLNVMPIESNHKPMKKYHRKVRNYQ